MLAKSSTVASVSSFFYYCLSYFFSSFFSSFFSPLSAFFYFLAPVAAVYYFLGLSVVLYYLAFFCFFPSFTLAASTLGCSAGLVSDFSSFLGSCVSVCRGLTSTGALASDFTTSPPVLSSSLAINLSKRRNVFLNLLSIADMQNNGYQQLIKINKSTQLSYQNSNIERIIQKFKGSIGQLIMIYSNGRDCWLHKFINILFYLMSQLDRIPISELYKEVNHITTHGISGYFVTKKYEDPVMMMKSRQLSNSTGKIKKYETKRGNYLDDASNARKYIPGPGKYTYSQPWPEKSKSMHHASKKITYIDEIFKKEKKEKRPGPNQYNIIKSDKQIEAEKKLMAAKKIKYNDKINYLDHVQYEALSSPGAGMYNPRDRMNTDWSKLSSKPEDWRKKHQNMEKNKKLPKMPDMRTYNPNPVDYALFSVNEKLKRNKNFLGKVERFKTEPSGSGLPPGKYAVIQQWRGKDVKKKQRHGIQSVSKGLSKSVYYN